MAGYILKHKNKNAAYFSLDEDGDFNEMDILSNKELPILGSGKKNVAQWIRDRAIPESRSDLGRILREAGCASPQEYLIKNLALSLSDTYWVCPEKERNIKWEDVSLYRHPTGSLTFKNNMFEVSRKRVKNNSSLGGTLEKYNLYKKDGWHLVKKGTSDIPYGLQNINEAFASWIHAQQGFQEYTRYTLDLDSHGVCTSCDCRYFTDEQHELVSAYNVTGGITGQSETSQDAYKEYLEECIYGGLDKNYVLHFMDYMLLTDFLITNADRHWENFGILRNPDTLEFISMAPIFDSGTSMMCKDPFANSRLSILREKVKGICATQQENLSLVQDRNAVDISKLPSMEETRRFYVERGIQEERAAQIALCYSLKKDMLIEFQHGLQISIGKEYEYNGVPPYKNGEPNPEYEGYRDKIRFVVLCGIPDAGKEKTAQAYIKNNANTAYIRTNNIRKKTGLETGEDEERVFAAAYKQIRQALKERKDVIFVATNLDRETRKKVLSLANGIPGVEKILTAMYKSPEEIESDIPMQKLKRAAEILAENKPDISEGWDRIDEYGQCQEQEHDHGPNSRLDNKQEAAEEEMNYHSH